MLEARTERLRSELSACVLDYVYLTYLFENTVSNSVFSWLHYRQLVQHSDSVSMVGVSMVGGKRIYSVFPWLRCSANFMHEVGFCYTVSKSQCDI